MVATGSIPPDVDTATPPVGVATQVQELIAFASYYLSAQLDRFRLTAINLAMFAVLGVLAAVTGVTVVLTASVCLVLGIAQMIGAVFGGRMWAGYLVTSVVVLGALFVGTIVVFKSVTKSTRGKLVAAYEQRKHEQWSSLGTDVDEQSRFRR